MKISIGTLGCRRFTLEVEPGDTVAALKRAIEADANTRNVPPLPAASLELFIGDVRLGDTRTVHDCVTEFGEAFLSGLRMRQVREDNQ